MTSAVADVAPRARLARSVAVSTGSQLIARGFDLIVNVAVSLAIVRYLGPQRFGDYVLVISIVGLAGLLSEFGLPKLAVREVARDPASQNRVVGTTMVLRLLLCIVSAIVAQLAVLAFDGSAALHLAALFACVHFVAEAVLTVAVVFHVALQQQYEAVARLAANVVKLAVVVVLVSRNAGFVELVAATTGSLVVGAVIAWWIARRRFELRPSFERARALPLLRTSLPVGPAMLIGVLYLKLGALMVALLATREAVGIYGAAYQPIEYLFLGSAVVVQVLFPLLARTHGRGHEFVRVYQRGTELLLALIVPVAIVLAISAAPLVEIAYDSEYAEAATPMALLAVALVFMTVNVWQGMVLLAADRQKANLAYLSAAVAFNFLLDLVLVPAFGATGAAWGTLVSAVFLTAWSTSAVARLAHARLTLHALARVAVANVFLASLLVGLLIVGVHWALSAVLVAAVYPLLLAGCRVFRLEDARSISRGGDVAAAELAGELS
jgi:O-antigen/teichoic acid export membrane protein